MYLSNALKLFTFNSISFLKSKNNYLILFTFFSLVITINIMNLKDINAAADSSLDQSIQQFTNNLLSNINKQIQSNLNSNNNINRGNCNSNVIVQSQTNNNGQTISTTSCGNGNSYSFSSPPSTSSNNINLDGLIESAQFNIQTGDLISSIFGYWSLENTQNGFNDFKSSFIRQPVIYNLLNSTLDISSSSNSNTANISTENINNEASSSLLSSSASTFNPNSQRETQTQQQQQQGHNVVFYNLANFRTTFISQTNLDKSFVGKIDVTKDTKPLDNNHPEEINNFKDVGVSIYLISNKILVIEFDKQSTLSSDFKDTPLVGLVNNQN